MMKRDWLREPVVVLPLSLALVFFLSLPFMLFGTQSAPQFYGAFFAALTGLLGILAGALYNAQLTRSRDDRLERLKVLAAARVARGELAHVRDYMERRQQTFNAVIKLPGGEVKHDPYLEYIVGNMRKEMATPVTDEHILQLCQQSEAIAEPLVTFRLLRSELLERADDVFVDLSAKRPVDTFAWILFTDKEEEVRDQLDLALPALKEFLSTHAGDFA